MPGSPVDAPDAPTPTCAAVLRDPGTRTARNGVHRPFRLAHHAAVTAGSHRGPAAPPVATPVGSGLRWIATATAIVTCLLVILGSTVRVTESGMGCPGWPLCYGSLGPIDRFHTLLEQSHRYLVAVVTVLVAVTAISALRQRTGRCRVRLPALVAGGMIVVQIVLGAITVFTHNAPPTVAAHLVTGFLLLMTVTVTATTAWVPLRDGSGRRLGPLVWWACAATLVLVVLGSLVVDGGARPYLSQLAVVPHRRGSRPPGSAPVGAPGRGAARRRAGDRLRGARKAALGRRSRRARMVGADDRFSAGDRRSRRGLRAVAGPGVPSGPAFGRRRRGAGLRRHPRHPRMARRRRPGAG